MKNLFKMIISFALVLVCGVLFTGCFRRMDNYLSVVPTDRNYTATMTQTLKTSSGNYTTDWKVIRKTENVCGENMVVIYVEYSSKDNNNHANDFNRTLLYVNSKVLGLSGENWVSYTGSFGDKWSDIYGSMSKPGSFVYELTDRINGRDFPQDIKTETQEYIEYDFGRDNEVFRISNDMYHLLLFYSFDNGTSSVSQSATFDYSEPQETIPYLSTITINLIS